MDWTTIAAVVSATIAVVSVLVGVYFTRKAIILQHEVKDLQQRATQLQYFAELRTWAGEAVQILADAAHLCNIDRGVYKLSEFLRERRALLCRLSAHVDRGRWFFPNVRQYDHSYEGKAGFFGFRHEIVDTLYRAYKVVGFLDYIQGNGNTPQRIDLQKLQRYFAHQIQEVLDPVNHDREFRQVIGEREGAPGQQESELPTLAHKYNAEELAAREMAEREMLEREREREMLERGPKERPERYGLRKKFWEGLLNRPKMKGTRHAVITPGEYSYIAAGGGVWGLVFRYVVRQDEGTVDLYIDRGAGKTTENKDIFDRLHKHKEEIEKTFGSGLSWQRADKQQSCRIAHKIPVGGYRSDEANWPAIHDAMIDAMVRLEKALAPHLEKL